jgi:hypothetical protein
VSRVLSPVDRYSGRSTVDSRPRRGGALASAWRAAATEGRSLPRKHLEKEGTEGNPTAVLVGAGVARLGRAMVDQGGGGSFLMGQSFGARRMGVGGGIGCGGEMGCSWSLYIGRDG